MINKILVTHNHFPGILKEHSRLCDLRMRPLEDDPWKSEPHFRKWVYKNTPCFILRQPVGGYLTGYCLVPPDTNDTDLKDIQVHGSITYNRKNALGERWIGFDCANDDDLVPLLLTAQGTYKNMEFVTNEVESLVDQVLDKVSKKCKD